MPLRKDYLLDQLRDFFEALTRIADRIQAGELERAEEEIDGLTSSAAIEELLRAGEPGASAGIGEAGVSAGTGEARALAGTGEPVPEHTYAAWKFQVQLLLLRIRLLEARGGSAVEYRVRAAEALRKLIALRPGTYDIELEEQLRGMEKS